MYNYNQNNPPLPPRRDTNLPYMSFPSPHPAQQQHPAAPTYPTNSPPAPYPAIPIYGGPHNPNTTTYPTPIPSPYVPPPRPDLHMQHPTASYSSTPAVSPSAGPDPSKYAELEKKLKAEREERQKLEEREVDRIKAISILEDQLRSLKLDMNRTAERAGMAAQIESKLHAEQDEKRRLQERLATTAQLESRLEYEQAERRRAEERLASYPATIAELERKVSLERSEKQRLEERVAVLASIEPLLKAEQEEKQRVERRLPELEAQLRASQKALADLGTRKADFERALESKDNEITALKKQLDQGAHAEELRSIHKAKADVESLLKSKEAEIAQLVERLNRENHERAGIASQLHALQLKYEPPVPPVGDEAVYQKPPPSQPLPVPKGVDHELWHLFTMVDPYQLKAINALQLRDIMNHGPWPPLEYSTVQILHSIYDRTGKALKFEHFTALWDLVHDWVAIFREHDHHQNETEFGYVERTELRAVLKKCGLAASEKFLTSFLSRGYQQERPLGWDDFMRIAAKVKLMMDSFKKIDMDKDNWITINYDQYLDLVISSM